MAEEVVCRVVKPTTQTVDELAPDAGSDAVSTAVIRAVAEAKGVATPELDARLYDVVEPDALERLFRYGCDGGGSWTGSVGFSLAGCDVLVRSDGRITVEEAVPGSLATPGPTAPPTRDDAPKAGADRGVGARDDPQSIGTVADTETDAHLCSSD